MRSITTCKQPNRKFKGNICFIKSSCLPDTSEEEQACIQKK